MYLIECSLVRDGRFSHTISNYVFDLYSHAEAWIARHGDLRTYTYSIVSAQVWSPKEEA